MFSKFFWSFKTCLRLINATINVTMRTMLGTELIAASFGLLSHVCYFIFGEHHLSAPRILKFYSLIILFIWIQGWRYNEGSLKQASALTTKICLSYFVSLFVSIVTYRIRFHRTSHFPGPFLAKVSKFYHALHITNSKQYLFLHRLNTEYGDFVRTGKLLSSFGKPALQYCFS